MNDPFLNDGCTGWIDRLRGADWRACCDAHDAAFLAGNSWSDFTIANQALRACVLASGAPWWMATLMFLAVMSPVGWAMMQRGKLRPIWQK